MRVDVDDPKTGFTLAARASDSMRRSFETRRSSLQDCADPLMGGEGVKPYQPPGLWEALGHQKSNTRVYVPIRAPKSIGAVFTSTGNGPVLIP